MARRRRSLLEDEDFRLVGKDQSSSGDVCEGCNCTRDKHHEDGCECGKCEEFEE
jgi:hypothetical protein